jgi:hypothetical protein
MPRLPPPHIKQLKLKSVSVIVVNIFGKNFSEWYIYSF